jgi:hypothetical protein
LKFDSNLCGDAGPLLREREEEEHHKEGKTLKLGFLLFLTSSPLSLLLQAPPKHHMAPSSLKQPGMGGEGEGSTTTAGKSTQMYA